MRVKDRKKNEMLKKLIEDIKSLTELSNSSTNSTIESIKQIKEKQTCTSFFKYDNKTRCYNTVVNDNLSPTMYAYYFCDKSRQVLSDKEAFAMKAIHIENNYDIPEEENKNDR